MKRLAGIVAAGLALTLVVFGGVAIASNNDYATTRYVNVAAGETVDKTLYAAGQTINVAGTVNGDVICAGQTVLISGTVNGDVICAGQEVRINGVVHGSVRAAGQTVGIAGTIDGSVSLAGQSVNIEQSAKVGVDTALAGNSLLVTGSLARDAHLGGAMITIPGTIGRNVEASGETIIVTKGAKIGGDLHYTSNNPAEVAEGTVAGTTSRSYPSTTHKTSGVSMAGFARLGFLILLSMYLCSMALVLIAPRRFDGVATEATEGFGKTVLVGVVAAFLIPVALGVVAVTVVGLPLAIFGGLLWLVASMLSGPVFAYIIGKRILSESRKPVAIMALGSLVLLVLYLIPVINVFAALAAYVVGLGAEMRATALALGKPRYSL